MCYGSHNECDKRQAQRRRRISHAMHEWVTSHMIDQCDISPMHIASCQYKWVMSHMNELCHIWMSHIIYEWVMSHMNENTPHRKTHSLIYKCDTSHMHIASCHIQMSHVTYKHVMSNMNPSTSPRKTRAFREKSQSYCRLSSICPGPLPPSCSVS